MPKKVAVVTASGIGDGLILHIASHHLARSGSEVTTFNDHLAGFGKWLAGYSFAKQPPLSEIEAQFASFDAVVLQHDNTNKSQQIHALDLPIYTLYGSHNLSKHGSLRETDFVCDPNRTMVDNVTEAVTKWFGLATTENGLVAPRGLIHRKYPLRIALHSSSGSEEKNWPQKKFDRVAEELKKGGYFPLFLNEPGGKPSLPSLEQLASFLYESGGFVGNDSGPGHLASYLDIPTLIIGKEARQMRLWAPGWRGAEIVTPPPWTSRWKWARKRWKQLISTGNVIKRLKCRLLRN